MKKWVKEIVHASPYWNKEGDPGIQIVDFTEKTMVLRAVASASDAPNAWNLRCEIREKLIEKIKKENMPLPMIRIHNEGSKFKA